ncbi:hypothetical protein ACIPMZ_15980 [Scandinavium goeteborgense]|uniref:hypothetical protein n=1 Tax=Scandinavium goeteborgense TaxID=1851514 RepID=UPI00380FF22F
MSDPNWVGYGGLVASALSALAAYLAIRQTIKQRRISNKVQLITKRNSFTICLGDLSTQLPLNKTSEEFEIAISAINAGLGPAIKVEYEWVFDYDKNLSNINVSKFSSEDISTNYGDRVNNEKYCYTHNNYENDNERMITIYGFGRVFPYIQKNKHIDESYILPYSADKKETILPFPKLILLILIQSMLNKLSDFERLFDQINGPALSIRYEDVTGVKEEIIFKTFIKLENISGGSGKPYHELNFSLICSHPYTWTALAREKLRKWYANIKRKIFF